MGRGRFDYANNCCNASFIVVGLRPSNMSKAVASAKSARNTQPTVPSPAGHLYKCRKPSRSAQCCSGNETYCKDRQGTKYSVP